MEMVRHDGGSQRLDLAIMAQLVSGDLFPLLQHRLTQRREIHARISKVHIELAEEVVATGDDDGDEIDATLVIVVAIAMRTMGGILRDGAVLVHGRIANECASNSD